MGLVPARLAADLAWAAPLPGGFSGSQLLGAALALVAITAAATQSPRLPVAFRGLAVGVLALIAVGAARAASPVAAASNALHLASPFAVWAVCAAAADEGIEARWRAAGAGVLAISAVVALASPLVVLNGWPRLVGAYGNVHGQAVVAAVIAASAWLAWWRSRKGADAALGVVSAAVLVATLVRGPLLFAVAAVATGVRGVWARVATVAAGLAAVGALAARWSDVAAVLTATPPPGGWGALGSHRARIWAESVTAFLAGPPLDPWLGRGLGGQLGLHRHLDPHQEWLSLWFQLGVGGVAAWAVAVAAAGRAAGPGPARGLVAGAVVLSFVGNDVVYRPSLVWWVAGAAGLAAGARRRGAG